ncbi:myosin phosphatase Rho-interacting protein-like [Solea senegalensis]|uniref:Myosin phosphatase Rho-interacting protein-like n=2 Tax=Solea senegalensis TaxID=28829 RepID=A0AAV6RIQ8_SOLSE|nr:myosin phosphatase Rho-interacting protein-like [Solea senegalensis]KAG7504699.1 myosin phosphatase Rho-interacting protein-like [Solea senegalensis]
MSGEKGANPCNKFQANIFNKSKCQNCFKSREIHLLNEHDQQQAKPVYGGWLCLAPEGTDFDNPMQRSRKWQRRFFILYEHGSLSFALDELRSTLPQGTVNLNLCTDIVDAEPRTGQRNALCIITAEQEIFIRGDNKEIIHGWSEQLVVYLRTNKQNQKKKRKVEPVTSQEPSPAKMAAPDPAESARGRWQEEQRGREPDVSPMWTVTADTAPGLEQNPAGNNTSTSVAPVDSLTQGGVGTFRSPRLDSLSTDGNADTGADDRLTESNNRNQSRERSRGSRAERILGSETTERGEGDAVSSRGAREQQQQEEEETLRSCGDSARLGAPPPHRRALERRTSDVVMTPDLLNFKKGWMVKLDKNNQWKKYWFVLSTDTLRYYKDSVTEESSDLEGEIDLTMCFHVCEYDVQRNYGFQIHTPEAVYTLSAMTAGIRKNWIQSLTRNVHPANAPDVTSSPGRHLHTHSPSEVLPKPDVTQDSRSSDVLSERRPQPKPRSVTERRREGRYRTFDWAEFRPRKKPTLETDRPRISAPLSLELGDLERRRRRQERRRRYKNMLGVSLSWEEVGAVTPDDGGGGIVRTLSPRSQQRVEEEMEECWRKVERSEFRLDRRVRLLTEDKDTVDMERLLNSCRERVEDLKAQLSESELRRLELETRELLTSLDPPLQSESFNNQAESPGGKNRVESGDISQQQDTQEQLGCEAPSSTPELTPATWLQDPGGDFQELKEGVTTLKLLDGGDGGLLTSEAQDEKTPLTACLAEQHIPPDQAMVSRLSTEVEVLSSQNEALNQRNQEMLNQLTEADREIARLRAELSSRYTEPHHLPEVEQGEQMRAEDLDQELSLKNKELLEAQTLITALKESLREKELLQLNVPQETGGAGKDKSEQKADGYLRRCFEATEEKMMELERQLLQSETKCRQLEAHNAELKEAERLCQLRSVEAEADIARLKQALKEDERVGREKRQVSGEDRIQHVMDGMVLRVEALERFLEVIDKLDFGKRRENEETIPAAVSQLIWEEKFWSSVLNELQTSTSETSKENSGEVLLREVSERMVVERQMLLLGHGLRPAIGSCTDDGKEGLKDLDLVLSTASVTEMETKDMNGSKIFGFMTQQRHSERFRVTAHVNMSLLNLVASSVSSSASEELRLITQQLKDSYLSESLCFGLVHSAATEALYCCYLNQLQSVCEKELQETEQKLLNCSSCVRLMEENKELRERLSDLGGQQASDQDVESHIPEVNGDADHSGDEIETAEEEMDESVEIQVLGNQEVSDGKESDPNLGTEEVSKLRRRVKELEESLSVTVEELSQEFHGKMSCVQQQHGKVVEKLKATCQRGLVSMEESHMKVVEELQRRHQQEVERLLVERDQLLEEESAATATAIAAIENAHRVELQRHMQERCQSKNDEVSAELEEMLEELASHQRELQVLSQQFSLKCLENGHLIQALEAERKALCQCQQENQDLRSRNQELSGHLAAEITRLCSLAKHDELPLSQRMDVYELEITLRVKECEVECLKQEVTSLKEEVQSAQRDKRIATKKYQDMFSEVKFIRVKAEGETNELRENLQLTRQVLDQASP